LLDVKKIIIFVFVVSLGNRIAGNV